MSMENAILAHAAALSELAAAVRALVDSSMGAVVTGGERVKGNAAAEAADKTETTEKSIKGTKPKASAGNENGGEAPGATSQENGAASGDNADAKTDAEKRELAGDPDTGTTDEPTLDYNKDVKPVLLAAIKRAGKEKVQALIKSFGVDKADQIDPAKFADLAAKAEAL